MRKQASALFTTIVLLGCQVLGCQVLGCQNSEVARTPEAERGNVAASVETETPSNPSSPTFAFATIDEARATLGTRDSFIERMTELDRGLRVGRAEVVSEEALLSHIASQALVWPDELIKKWQPALIELQRALEGLHVPLPSRVTLILTTGKEELGAPHTRQASIVIPIDVARDAPAPLHLLAHELFHVASRHAPSIRDPIYAALGFKRVERVAYPPEIASRKITNPDALDFEHAIAVMRRDTQQLVDVVPLFYSRHQLSDAIKAGLMGSLALELLVVGSDRLLQVDATDYLERASLNTEYAIHPEETAADNFGLIVAKRLGNAKRVKRQDVLDQIETVLSAKRPR